MAFHSVQMVEGTILIFGGTPYTSFPSDANQKGKRTRFAVRPAGGRGTGGMSHAEMRRRGGLGGKVLHERTKRKQKGRRESGRDVGIENHENRSADMARRGREVDGVRQLGKTVFCRWAARLCKTRGLGAGRERPPGGGFSAATRRGGRRWRRGGRSRGGGVCRRGPCGCGCRGRRGGRRGRRHGGRKGRRRVRPWW